MKQNKFTLEQLELTFFKYIYEDDYIVSTTSTPKTHNTENKSVRKNNRLYENPVRISKKKKMI